LPFRSGTQPSDPAEGGVCPLTMKLPASRIDEIAAVVAKIRRYGNVTS
jgi:hypothetical protein